MKRLFAMFMALALTALVPLSAQASGGHDLNGAELSILWVVPFVCMLLSIAIGPLAVPHFWHHHFGKVALFWGLAFLVPCAMVFGLQLAVYQFVHVLFMEYVRSSSCCSHCSQSRVASASKVSSWARLW